MDWGTEVVFQEGPPARGDLATNVALGFTLLWLPLSIAAVGRALWVNYKITDKRVSVTSTSPFGAEQLDASYAQMTEVRAIGRGLGYWGDMVIVLQDGSKIEMRSIDNWLEVKKYIESRIADVQAAKEARWAGKLVGGVMYPSPSTLSIAHYETRSVEECFARSAMLTPGTMMLKARPCCDPKLTQVCRLYASSPASKLRHLTLCFVTRLYASSRRCATTLCFVT